MVAHIYRHYGSKPAWTPEETAILRELYPEADRLDILQALPKRSWRNINQNAALIGLSRHTMKNSSGIHENLAWADVEIMRGDELDPKTPPWKSPDDILVRERKGTHFVPFQYKIDNECR